MTKPKLVDVAHAAGVSKSTVSQYLNGRFNYMSLDTKTRIEQAIDELNYVPNSIAQSLKTNKTNNIGVIVRDITGSYTSCAIRGMDDYCKKNGYHLVIYNSDFDAGAEAKALAALNQLRVDGILIASTGQNNDALAANQQQGIPVVQFQLERDESPKNIIVSDYKRGAFDAVEYLIQLGHRRICFLTQEFENVTSRKERYHGYLDALHSYNIPFDEELIQYWHRDKGFLNSPTSLLQKDPPPTAFFAQHLAVTVDLLKHFNTANIQIPEQVSVIGFDELPMAEFFKVPITVVKQQPYAVGEAAAQLLISHIEDPETEPQRIMIPCSLIKRDSCKNIN